VRVRDGAARDIVMERDMCIYARLVKVGLQQVRASVQGTFRYLAGYTVRKLKGGATDLCTRCHYTSYDDYPRSV